MTIKALRAAFEKNDVHGRLTRWLKLMAEYAFEIQHLPCGKNVVADYLMSSFGEAGLDAHPDDHVKITPFMARTQPAPEALVALSDQLFV